MHEFDLSLFVTDITALRMHPDGTASGQNRAGDNATEAAVSWTAVPRKIKLSSSSPASKS